MSSPSLYFLCLYCREHNADLNGAINITIKYRRWMGYKPFHGKLSQPLTMQYAEAHDFSHGQFAAAFTTFSLDG